MKLGRSESSLRRYLRALEGRDKVQVVVMDMSETYRRIAKRYFPRSNHCGRPVSRCKTNQSTLLKVWQQYDPEGRKNRGLISLMRRHQWHLSDEQHANLMVYLAEYPVLQTLYVVKQN